MTVTASNRRERKGGRAVAAWTALAVGLLLSSACRSERPSGGAPQQLPPASPTPYVLRYPLGLSGESAVIPPDNPMTVEKVRLGRLLFFEKRLSFDQSLSCAGCHVPEKGFADPVPFSMGVGGKKGRRHTPTVVNRIFSGAQFWDGRAASLEEQALGPMLNPVEMAMPSMALAIERLKADPAYADSFKAAFPPDGLVTAENVAKAIASFERTILSGNSPFDRFIAGDSNAMSPAAKRGWEIFNDENRGDCVTCHVSSSFTDENYNNLGIGMARPHPDLGRYEVTRLEGHQGAFKTPTLREVARTAPYLHDGSEPTLEGVIDLYAKGGHPNRWLSPKMRRLRLTTHDKSDLVEFLKALSGEVGWYGMGAEHQLRSAR
jgi:cytochrome c peroxidase